MIAPALRPMPARTDTADGITIWSRDHVAVFMPTPRRSWGPAVMVVYMARVEANMTGQCPLCLAVSDAHPTAPGHAAGAIAHARDCSVADAAFARWLR